MQNYTFQLLLLSKEDNTDFIEQQNKGFQRSIYWNEYKTKEKDEDGNANAVKYISLDPSFQGVNGLFLMAYSRVNNNQPQRDGQRKYYLPRIDLKNITLLSMDEIFTVIQSKVILKKIEN